MICINSSVILIAIETLRAEGPFSQNKAEIEDRQKTIAVSITMLHFSAM